MKRNSLVIITACIIGLITASAYSSRLKHMRDEIANFSERIPVLTANRNVQAGEILRTEDLKKKLILKEQASLRSVLPEDLELVVGRYLMHPIPADGQVLWTDFPEGPRLRKPSEKIPSGYRAIALPADETHTLVHLISPGDKVDIVSSSFENPEGKLISQLIAENISVMSVGRQLESSTPTSDSGEYPLSVTLLVDPDNALAILRASQTGEVHFLVRGSNLLLDIVNHDIRNDSPTNDRMGRK